VAHYIVHLTCSVHHCIEKEKFQFSLECCCRRQSFQIRIVGNAFQMRGVVTENSHVNRAFRSCHVEVTSVDARRFDWVGMSVTGIRRLLTYCSVCPFSNKRLVNYQTKSVVDPGCYQ